MNSDMKTIAQIELLQKQLEKSRKNFYDKEEKLKASYKIKLAKLKENYKKSEKKILNEIASLEQSTVKAKAAVVDKLISSLDSSELPEEIKNIFSEDTVAYLKKLADIEKNVKNNPSKSKNKNNDEDLTNVDQNEGVDDEDMNVMNENEIDE